MRARTTPWETYLDGDDQGTDKIARVEGSGVGSDGLGRIERWAEEVVSG